MIGLWEGLLSTEIGKPLATCKSYFLQPRLNVWDNRALRTDLLLGDSKPSATTHDGLKLG